MLPDLPLEEMWQAGLSPHRAPSFSPGILLRFPFLCSHRGEEEVTDQIPSSFPWKRHVRNNAMLDCIDLCSHEIILGRLFPSHLQRLFEGEISSQHDTFRAHHNSRVRGGHGLRTLPSPDRVQLNLWALTLALFVRELKTHQVSLPT